MNVQIVLSDYQSDRILPRLARCLSEQTGWPVATTPRGGVDWNIFAVYIDYAESHPTFHDTPIAAWFTHHEPDHKLKGGWWQYAAKNLDLRLTSAKLYADELSRYGPTVQIRPPLDRDKFTIMPHDVRNSVPVIGVSGFIPKRRTGQTGPGRKGEHLVERLANSDFGRSQMRLVASGRGWPVRRQSSRPVDELPAFYQSLDVLLCTSLIEGIPMPPLEALACGVPVVIPDGVGMLDELPEGLLGIWRYERGNYADMVLALKSALTHIGNVDPEALRTVTEPFTPQNWARDIKAALEGMLYDVPANEPKQGKRGVFYVAYGAPARKYVQTAITTFKAHMPDVPAALVSDEPLGPEDLFIEHPDVDIGGRCAKTKIWDLAPAEWDFVLYLDADTEIIADIGFLYRVLEDGWDFVICKNPARFHTIKNMVRPDNADECNVTYRKLGSKELLQLNGGVFAFRRNERTRAFFHAWHEEWQRWGKRDQAALLRALWDHPLRMFILTNHWNTVVRYDPANISAGILHFPQRVRRWEGLIHGRADDANAWKMVEEWEAQRGG